MPIKKSLGFEATLVKSFTVKDAPNPNMISAKAIGAIVVTIPICDSAKKYSGYFIKDKEDYEIVKRLRTLRKNFALFLKTSL